MKSSDIKLRLVLTSKTLSPEQISARAKITPSKTWRSGDVVHPRATNRHKENGCTVEVVDTALSAAAKRLSDQLRDQSATLTNLADIDVELSCVVNVHGSVPELHLDPEIVAFAASIKAALDFDVYVLSSADRGE
jgi:Domain of unknown function (DUF4279)